MPSRFIRLYLLGYFDDEEETEDVEQKEPEDGPFPSEEEKNSVKLKFFKRVFLKKESKPRGQVEQIINVIFIK